MNAVPRLPLFPLASGVNKLGHLTIGGCDAVELAKEFGTPLYVFDEDTLRQKCGEFKTGFKKHYPDTSVVYASKAFLNRAMASLLKEEGLGLDVVSAGELNIARSVDFPLEQVYFHGNNKSATELALALEWGIGHIVVDNWHELKILGELMAKQDYDTRILIRLSPGVDPHTHHFIATGITDSKFGFPLVNGEGAASAAMATFGKKFIGLHFHLGSLLFEVEPYRQAIDALLDFAAALKKKHRFELRELNIGGGFAIQYGLDSPAPPVSTYASAISSRLKGKCRELKLPAPSLVIEPGRAIVGQAGVALYSVGAIKDIPGVRCYVSLDGGMADNIRPALYGSKYEAVVANKMRKNEARAVTLAGKFCESGDILIKDISLPRIIAGDIIAIPDCGAYCLAMASNYNASLKAAIVLVKNGKPRLIRRRETFDDLVACDVI